MLLYMSNESLEIFILLLSQRRLTDYHPQVVPLPVLPHGLAPLRDLPAVPEGGAEGKAKEGEGKGWNE